MDQPNHDLLRQAIARNSGIVLSLPSDAGLRHHRSRFLAEAAGDEAADGAAFWVESVPAERSAIDSLMASGRAVGITFKSAVHKISLAAPLRRHEAAYQVNTGLMVEALLLPYPQAIKAVQRRDSYRVSVGAESELIARAWRIGPRAYIADRPSASQEFKVSLRDLSLGGAGMTIVGRDEAPPAVTPDERLRIEVIYGELPPLLLDAVVRHINPAAPAAAALQAGVMFRGLESDIEGRRTRGVLAKIVGELQREEVKRARREKPNVTRDA